VPAAAPAPAPGRFDRPHQKVDPALVDELRKRNKVKTTVVNTTKIVREKPIVVETRRYVDDPPRIVERRHYVDDEPAPPKKNKHVAVIEDDTGKLAPNHDDGKKHADSEKRVIEADAVITILGPDRMSIKLLRKRSRAGGKANARAE
jgi:hypothetical protein